MPFKGKRKGPARKVHPKRRGVRVGRRAVKRGVKSNRMILVNRAPTGFPIAPRMFTKFVQDCTFDVNVNAGSPTGFFDLNLNGMPSPFSTGLVYTYNNTTFYGSGGSVYETVYAGTTAANTIPTGLGELTNPTPGSSGTHPNLYNAVRVNGVSVMARVVNMGRSSSGVPNPYGGELQFGFHPYCPANTNSLSAGAQAATTLNRLLDSPMSKSMLVGVATASNKQNTIKKFYKLRDIMGISKRALEDDLSGQAVSQLISAGGDQTWTNPSKFSVFLRCLYACSGGELNLGESLQFTVQIRLVFYVELFNAGLAQIAYGN